MILNNYKNLPHYHYQVLIYKHPTIIKNDKTDDYNKKNKISINSKTKINNISSLEEIRKMIANITLKYKNSKNIINKNDYLLDVELKY